MRKLRRQRLINTLGVLGSSIAAAAFLALPVYGQRLDPVLLDAFLTDPLKADPKDPLIPDTQVERPLSPLELYEIELELFRMDAEAQELLLLDQPNEAFELWMREVQLRRLFGIEAELVALERIGQQAWNAQRDQEVRLMSVRVKRIWEAEKATASLERVETIATIAQILRMRDTSTEIYQQLIAMTAGDDEAQLTWEVLLADHYLQWFDFANAAQMYTALVAHAKVQGNTLEHTQYLKNLIYSHQEAKQYTQALPAQAKLLRLYRTTGQSNFEPPLEIDMARNFKAIGVYSKAVDYYQLAYTTAQRLELYGHVSTVLRELGDLYAERGLTNEALTMYNLLVRAEQQAYNQYGILAAYDRLGQLYLTADDPENALIAFRAGLAFSESLKYREPYFRAEVAKLSLGAPNTPSPEPTAPNPSLGDTLREDLRDNPPFDATPVELEPLDTAPPEVIVEPDVPAAPPEVEVITDETVEPE